MKRIVFSLSTVLMVGALAAGATGAFFSDTETSANNIFTAGSIDLKIDHSLSTYNGTSDLTVVSDPVTTFVSNPGTAALSGPAVNLTFVHPVWETIPGAHWIWATDPVSDPAGPDDQSYTFTRTFNWSGPIASASIDYGADNYFDVFINGTPLPGGSNHALITDNFQLPHTTDVTSLIVQGVNTITFVGENQHIDASDFNSNPAGIIFKLVVHGQQTFGPTDLTDQTFWNFDDVKPADTGRDVMSLHVDTNDAWTCMLIGNVKNDENTLISPETAAGDIGPAGLGNGELGQYLSLFLWHDLDGDGNYNPPTETAIGTISNPFTGSPATTTIALHDSTTLNGPQLGGTLENVGSAWCAGTLSVDNTSGAISCNGAIVSNAAQTDSTKADLTFYATQARNQPNFSCSSLN